MHVGSGKNILDNSTYITTCIQYTRTQWLQSTWNIFIFISALHIWLQFLCLYWQPNATHVYLRFTSWFLRPCGVGPPCCVRGCRERREVWRPIVTSGAQTLIAFGNAWGWVCACFWWNRLCVGRCDTTVGFVQVFAGEMLHYPDTEAVTEYIHSGTETIPAELNTKCNRPSIVGQYSYSGKRVTLYFQ